MNSNLDFSTTENSGMYPPTPNESRHGCQSMMSNPGCLGLAVLSVIVSVISLYIFIAQLIFCIVWFCLNQTKDHLERFSIILCVFSSFTAFLRIGVGLALITFRTNLTDNLCNSYYDYKVALYGIAYISMWTVLWLRQRHFYYSPTLMTLYSTFIRCISNGVEVFMILGVLGSTVFYYSTRDYEGNVGVDGCSAKDGNRQSNIWAFDFVCIFVLQSILLLLFVYPLWSHARRLKRSNTFSSSASRKKATSSLRESMLRATVTSGVCMFANLASVPIQYVVAAKFGSVFDFLYDLSLLLQLIAVIALFKDWRKRFFPWLLMCNRSQNNGVEISSSSK